MFYLSQFDDWIYNPHYDPVEVAVTARLRQQQADELGERMEPTEILEMYWPPPEPDEALARYEKEREDCCSDCAEKFVGEFDVVEGQMLPLA